MIIATAWQTELYYQAVKIVKQHFMGNKRCLTGGSELLKASEHHKTSDRLQNLLNFKQPLKGIC